MTTFTADEFRNARFATHPDGRVAARVDRGDKYPWVASPRDPDRDYWWCTDEGMARDGWSPLDESHPFPCVATDEMVHAAVAANYTPAAKSGIYGYMRHIVAAALSVAPMTDEDARTYALEQIEAAQAETTEAVARAEKAERERDEAIREAEELGEALDNVKPVDTMTAREHLDAAWDAAYVPADGTIPGRTPFLFRTKHGTDRRVSMSTGAPDDLPTNSVAGERRLLDPPTPARPDWKRLEDLLREQPSGTVTEAARWLIEHGVRAPEDGEER